ncbi:MAG: MFS transporter, partial [Pseudomonadota bacterium]
MSDTPTGRNPTSAILSIVVLSGFLSGYDYTALNVVVPTLAKHFDTSFSIASWVLLSFAIVFVAFAIPATSLIGAFGLRRMMLTGFSVFAVGSLLCSLSDTIYELAAFRGLQALGGSILFISSPALVRLRIPRNARGKSYGFVALAPSIGMCVGPSIGALLISKFGWPSIFVLNLPICALGLALTFRFVRDEADSDRRPKVDVLGSTSIFVGLSALVLAVNQGSELGWTSAWILAGFGTACAGLAIFVRYELSTDKAALDLRLLAERIFGTGALSAFLQMFVVGGIMFTFPIYLELGKGLPTTHAGYLITVQSLALIVISLASGPINEHVNSLRICRIALCLLTLTMIVLSQDFRLGTVYLAGTSLALLGLSKGLFAPAILKATLDDIPESWALNASGLISTIRVLGQLLGIVVFETILSATVGADTTSFAQGTVHAAEFRSIFWVAIGLSVLPFLPLMLRTTGKRPSHPGG